MSTVISIIMGIFTTIGFLVVLGILSIWLYNPIKDRILVLKGFKFYQLTRDFDPDGSGGYECKYKWFKSYEESEEWRDKYYKEFESIEEVYPEDKRIPDHK